MSFLVIVVLLSSLFNVLSIYSINGRAEPYPIDFFPDIFQNSNDTSPFGKEIHLSKYYLRHKHRFYHWYNLLTTMSDPKHSRWSNNNMNVTIVFLGGSLTHGHGINMFPKRNITSFCNNNLELCPIDITAMGYIPCISCAFPKRFEYWLQQNYPYLTINVYNLAKGGINTESILGTVDIYLNNIPTVIDVIFLNYVDNDRNFGERANGHISAAFEQLIRYLQVYNTNITIIDIEMYSNTPSLTYPPHELVLQHYHIPTINYDKIVHSKLHMTERHPPWAYHQLISDVLSYTWLIANKTAFYTTYKHTSNIIITTKYKLPSPIPQLYNYHTRIPPVCTAITHLDAQYCTHIADKCESAINTINTTGTLGEWVLGQDRPEKYGWYIDSLSGGQLQVTLYITNLNPTVIIGYLKSYECRGTVKVYVKGHPDDYNLINSTMAQYSQTYIHRVCLKKHIICHDTYAGAIPHDIGINKLEAPIDIIIELLPTPTTTAIDILVSPIHYTHHHKQQQQKRGLVTSGNITKCIGNRFKIAYIKSCV